MVSLQLVRSSVAWSFTPAQLLCNSHYANIYNNFTTEISLRLVCDDLAASFAVSLRPWRTHDWSLQQMSSQLLCNCFAASSQIPHLHISFACEILFAVISPWSSSDLAAIISHNSLFVYMGFSSICPIPTFWFYPRWGCAFSNALYCTVLIFDTEVHWNNYRYLKYALSAWSQLIWNQII